VEFPPKSQAEGAVAQAAPERLGKYPLLSVIGTGSMGVVYKSFDPYNNRPIALKTIRRELLDDEMENFPARFRIEAQAAEGLTHPGIVGVYEYGEAEGYAYIAMEYVEGHSLRDCLERQVRFNTDQAISILAQLLEALQYAHEHGVWHRDVKPANILLMSDGRIKVTDFGIACVESLNMAQADPIMGTPGFIAPELYLSDEFDQRIDLFAAGVVLYHLLAGVPPFAGTADKIMLKVCYETPLPVSVVARQPSLRRFDAIVLKALATSPEDRFSSAKEFLEALVLAQAGGPAGADATVIVSRGQAQAGVPIGADETRIVSRGQARVDVPVSADETRIVSRGQAQVGAPIGADETRIVSRGQAQAGVPVSADETRIVSRGQAQVDVPVRADETRILSPELARPASVDKTLVISRPAGDSAGVDKTLVISRPAGDSAGVDKTLVISRPAGDSAGVDKTLVISRPAGDSAGVDKTLIISRPPGGPASADKTLIISRGAVPDDAHHTIILPSSKDFPLTEPLPPLEAREPDADKQPISEQKSVRQPPSASEPQDLGQSQSAGESQSVRQSQSTRQQSSEPQSDRRTQSDRRSQSASQSQSVSPSQGDSEPQDVRQSQSASQPKSVRQSQAVSPPQAVRQSQSASEPQTANSPSHGPGWNAQELTQIEKQLAHFVGPIARVLVRSAARETSDLVSLIQWVALKITSSTDREAFLRGIGVGWVSQTKLARSTSGAQVFGAALAGGGEPLTPEYVTQAAQHLAVHLGPIAKVLAKRAAQPGSSREQFVTTLATHLTDDRERARFLRALA
jgi:predicted Ser/Thr protein kinase